MIKKDTNKYNFESIIIIFNFFFFYIREKERTNIQQTRISEKMKEEEQKDSPFHFLFFCKIILGIT